MGNHQLRSVPVNILECVKDIGMKTARFFVMHSRPNQQVACLDTHILKWLGEQGHEVPTRTPRGQKYLDLEKIFLDYCNKMGKTPAQLDLEIWNGAHEKNN
jgi:thermostable 8-oxoguanine DNA glycosylase